MYGFKNVEKYHVITRLCYSKSLMLHVSQDNIIIISISLHFSPFSRHGQNTFPSSIRSCQIQTMVTTSTNRQTFHSVWKELTKKRTPSQTRTDTLYKRYSESSVGSCVEPELWSKDPKFEDYEKKNKCGHQLSSDGELCLEKLLHL